MVKICPQLLLILCISVQWFVSWPGALKNITHKDVSQNKKLKPTVWYSDLFFMLYTLYFTYLDSNLQLPIQITAEWPPAVSNVKEK